MVRRAVNERAAKDTVNAFKTVVLTDGTAVKAQLEHYTVAGKTGTAQKPVPGWLLRRICGIVHWVFPGGRSGSMHFDHAR